MRSESELLVDFKRGDDNSQAYWRERVMVEVLLDIRSLMKQLVSKL
jgi:hypothetical protein